MTNIWLCATVKTLGGLEHSLDQDFAAKLFFVTNNTVCHHGDSGRAGTLSGLRFGRIKSVLYDKYSGVVPPLRLWEG